jgi:hypothetical protein
LEHNVSVLDEEVENDINEHEEYLVSF